MSGIICFRVFHLQLGAARDNLVARCSLLVAVGTNMSYEQCRFSGEL